MPNVMETASQPGPRLRTAVIVMVVGVLVALIGAAFVLPTVLRTVLGRTHDVPGTVHMTLESGSYTVYERTGSTTQFGPFFASHDRAPDITPDQVQVTDSSGVPITVQAVCACNTITRRNTHYTSAVAFRTPRHDTYTIVFNTGPATVIVGQSFGDMIRSRRPWLAVGGLGIVIFLGGAVMIMIGTIRRTRPNRVPAVPVSAVQNTPPGWFPDPTQAGRLRYWDGARWTEHTS
jgi:hypothetical protein